MPVRRIVALLRTGTYDKFPFAEVPAFRHISSSLPEMAVITGVLVRCLRALALSSPGNSGAYYVTAISVGLIILVGMLTLHLANFQVRQWLWRVPAFALLEPITEAIVSLALIAVHREPWGAVRASYQDWPSLALGVLLIRLVVIGGFGFLLAGVVQWVRYAMLRHEHRL